MFRYQSVSSDWKNVKKHLEIVGTRRFLTNREMARLVRRWVDMVTYPSQTRVMEADLALIRTLRLGGDECKKRGQAIYCCFLILYS